MREGEREGRREREGVGGREGRREGERGVEGGRGREGGRDGERDRETQLEIAKLVTKSVEYLITYSCIRPRD